MDKEPTTPLAYRPYQCSRNCRPCQKEFSVSRAELHVQINPTYTFLHLLQTSSRPGYQWAPKLDECIWWYSLLKDNMEEDECIWFIAGQHGGGNCQYYFSSPLFHWWYSSSNIHSLTLFATSIWLVLLVCQLSLRVGLESDGWLRLGPSYSSLFINKRIIIPRLMIFNPTTFCKIISLSFHFTKFITFVLNMRIASFLSAIMAIVPAIISAAPMPLNANLLHRNPGDGNFLYPGGLGDPLNAGFAVKPSSPLAQPINRWTVSIPNMCKEQATVINNGKARCAPENIDVFEVSFEDSPRRSWVICRCKDSPATEAVSSQFLSCVSFYWHLDIGYRISLPKLDVFRPVWGSLFGISCHSTLEVVPLPLAAILHSWVPSIQLSF